MTRLLIRMLLFWGILLGVIGCAARQPVGDSFLFKAVNLNSWIRSGEYVQRVDHFLVILDASGTMKLTNYQTARRLAQNMNLTIPNLKLKAGIRVFGKDGAGLVYGMVDYTKSGFNKAIPATGGYGESPLGETIAAAGEDLKQASGNIALIVFSDGRETGASGIDAAERLKNQYGDRLCIYSVQLGSSSRGRSTLEGVTRAAKCGFVVSAEEIQSPEGVADFVMKIFLAKAPPKPQPVVPPALPTPPPSPPVVKEEPKPEPVVAPPKVLDSDGDGVPDDVDKCPGTPRGAKVDKDGCWVLPIIYFDTDKSNIKEEFFPSLDEVAMVLKNNPDVRMVIAGYTDSRGTDSHNTKLSEKRAKEVQSYFIKSGVEPVRLTPKGYGETSPVKPNTSKENMTMNRRVELLPVK